MKKKLNILILLLTIAISAIGENTYAESSLLSSGKWVKIRVKDEGVYQLTESNLKSMGFSNPSHVRLYGYNRPLLPEANIQNIEDDLTEIPLYRGSSTGALLFYSKGVTEWKRTSSYTSNFSHKNNPYSSYIYYFLTEDSSITPATFEQVNSATESSPTQTTYYAHSILESDAYSFLNCGRTFFESYDYSSGNTKSYNITLAGVPKNDVSLTIQFGAAGSSSSTLTISSDGTTVGTMSFSRLEEYQYASVTNRTFTLADVSSNKLNITLQHNRTSGITGHLDYIQACYETSLELNGNYVAFTPNTAGNKIFGIQNANSNITLWKVTSPSETCELVGTLSGSYNASAASTKITDLFVALDKSATYPTPETVGTVKNQNLHGLANVNLLIIVPASGKLTAQAQRLADAHSVTDGITCAVVSADQIYNEFSSGTPDLTAYRRLAKMLYDKDNSLQNILLFGACHWDNRFLTTGLKSLNPNDYLLVYESDNSWSHTDSYTAEEYIALLDDGEGVSPLKEKPDAGVGRLPVVTETEARQVVDKLINYINNKEAGSWKNTICMMGDDGNANIHMMDAENVLSNTESLYPDYRYKRIYWDSYELVRSATGSSYPDVHSEIDRTMEEGALIMNYTGHGAAYTLSYEQVLKTVDFANWDSPRLPLWFTAACDVCPFDMNTENLAVTAVLNPNGAAMGMVSTARTVYSSPNRTLNRNFMKWVLASNTTGERYTIGEALALAKCDIIDSKTTLSKLDSINKAHYVLIGDPAIRLITPKYKVYIDDIGGSYDEDDTPILKAGSIVSITGHVVDEEGNATPNYNGIVYPTIFDSEELITCNNNDLSAEAPYHYYDRTKILYSGSDSIRSGKFTFSFAVPFDLNYSDSNGLMKIYTVNNDHSVEAHGTYSDFIFGAVNDSLATDTIGPDISIWLNSLSFYNGMHVGTTPTLYAKISDSSGINTTGNGVGHDIVAIIDNKESTSYSLNNYFYQTAGDYTSGTITYTLPSLNAGEHTLVLRAFDIFNNPSTATITFVVVEGEETIETFDMSGRLLNSSHTTAYPPGVYIRRHTYRQDNEIIEERTEKFIITQ